MKFWSTIKNLIIAALPFLIVAGFFILLCVTIIPENEKVAFLLGVIASVIATLLTKWLDKVAEWKKAISKIFELSQKFIIYFKDASKNGKFDCQTHIYKMMEIYFEMCYAASDVRISNEYMQLSFAMDAVISDMKENKSLEEIGEKMGVVVAARENLKF